MKQTTKRLCSILLTAMMLLTLAIPMTVAASAADSWGAYAAKTAEGDLRISDAEQLAGFAAAVNSGADFAGYTVALAADIDLSAHIWEPIGGSGKFSGTFDGNGYTVSGITVKTGTYQGFFGAIAGATVKELTVSGSINATAGTYHGGIAAVATSGVNNIINCKNNVTVSAGTVKHAAGILGAAIGGTTNIDFCANLAPVTGGYAAAGICSFVKAATLNINNSYNTGLISATSVSSYAVAGGLVGLAYTSSVITVKNSFNGGMVKHATASTRGAGGLLGYGYSGRATISNCYNFGAISGTLTGQLVGYRKSTVTYLYYSYYYKNASPAKLVYNSVNLKTTCASFSSMASLLTLLNSKTAAYGGAGFAITTASNPVPAFPAIDNTIAIAEPVVTEPEVTEPAAPAVTEPAVTEPAVTEPAAPVVTEPAATEPAAPAVTEPAATEPEVTEPAAPAATYYTVTFKSNKGSAVASIQVKEGEVLVAPAAPTRAGYTFVGWYTTSRLNVSYKYTPVTGNITLYARWLRG